MRLPPDPEEKGHSPSAPEGLDGEHQIQVGLIDALEEACAERRDPAVQRAILDQLLEYSRVHFLSEQLLMRLHAYPAYERHVREHEHMTEQLFDLSEHLRAGEREIGEETLRRLREELVGHIQTRDLELNNFLQRNSLEAREG